MNIQPTVMVKTEQPKKPKKHTAAKVLVGAAALTAATYGLAKTGSQGGFTKLVSKYKKAAVLTGIAKKLDSAGTFINNKASNLYVKERIDALRYKAPKLYIKERIGAFAYHAGNSVSNVFGKAKTAVSGLVEKGKTAALGLAEKAKTSISGLFSKAQ